MSAPTPPNRKSTVALALAFNSPTREIVASDSRLTLDSTRTVIVFDDPATGKLCDISRPTNCGIKVLSGSLPSVTPNTVPVCLSISCKAIRTFALCASTATDGEICSNDGFCTTKLISYILVLNIFRPAHTVRVRDISLEFHRAIPLVPFALQNKADLPSRLLTLIGTRDEVNWALSSDEILIEEPESRSTLTASCNCKTFLADGRKLLWPAVLFKKDGTTTCSGSAPFSTPSSSVP
eukprot:346149-Rhodomonas_salina.1